MRRLLKTEAFILRKKQLLQKDAVIVLFSSELGKMTAVAKGVHSITSRRLASLMTGNLVRAVFAESHAFHYLQQVETVSQFSRIKKSPEALRQAYLFLYLADNLLPEGQREPEIYLKIKKIMIALSKKPFSLKEETEECRVLLSLFGYTLKSETRSQLISEIEEIIGKKIPPIVYN